MAKKVIIKKSPAGPKYVKLNPKTTDQQNRFKAESNLGAARH
jgi:hypothetical protein